MIKELELWPKCAVPVNDGHGGFEPCNEDVVSKRIRACHDHAKVCLNAGCDEPRNPWESFCPDHRLG